MITNQSCKLVMGRWMLYNALLYEGVGLLCCYLACKSITVRCCDSIPLSCCLSCALLLPSINIPTQLCKQSSMHELPARIDSQTWNAGGTPRREPAPQGRVTRRPSAARTACLGSS